MLFIKENLHKIILTFVLIVLFFVNLGQQNLWIAFAIWLIIMFSPKTKFSDQNKTK